MILKEPIQFEPRETIHMRINYIGLLKRRSFVITAIYLAAIYAVLDSNTPKIAILTNLTKKCLEFNKNIRLGTIYKYVDIVYIIVDISKAFIIVAIAFSVFSDLFFAV